MNRYLERRARTGGIGKSGVKSEKRLTKKLGGKATPASGAIEGHKGDFELGDFLMEAKSTVGDSLGVKFDWLVKIKKEARSKGKSPALTISFVNEQGRPYPNGEWVAVPLDVFERLTSKE